MNPPRDVSVPSGVLTRYTPDSRQWRLRIAGFTAVAAPLALYGTFAVASGVKSGPVYNLLVALFGVLALVFPAVGVATVLAPDSQFVRTESSDSGDPVGTLKRRYAAGEIERAEFDRRLDDLIETSERVDRRTDDHGSDRPMADGELDRARL